MKKQISLLSLVLAMGCASVPAIDMTPKPDAIRGETK